MVNRAITLMNYDLDKDWLFRQAGRNDWYPATVPGYVHLDLLNNNLIEDPFYRDNETKVQWIENEDWEYLLVFDIPQEILTKKHIQLIFEGLDAYATVTLNGQQIIEADNMFRSWKAKIKLLLKERGNELTVLFRSPIQQVLPKLEKANQKLPAMSDLSIGTSPYTRKAPFHYGWDWGPRLVTSGIWQPVKLEAWDSIKITDQRFIVKELSANKALLEMSIDVLSDIDSEALLKIYDDKNNFTLDDKIRLKIGLNIITREIEIPDPKPWWPNGYGDHPIPITQLLDRPNTQLPNYPIAQLPDKQPLYTFQTEIATEHESVVMSKRIGLRTLELKQEKDQWGESFTIVVNGVPIFAKGANWIPSDSFTPRVSKEKYRHLLTGAVQANMNMVRVWGGGIYEADEFYDLCDELGILVWQDFMFSCALYPGDDQFLKSVKQEATYQVRRLRHHPCIALWCGNNEIEMGWHDWGWQEKLQASMWEDYLKLFHGVLPEVCHNEDPQRFYWSSSPASDSAAILNPNDSAQGDTHYWGVWHGKEPFDDYKKHFPRFISEYGFQSFPAPESVNKFTTKADHDVFSPVMLIHQKNRRGNALIKEYLEKYCTVPNDFKYFLLLSQVLQAEGIKVGAEHFRRIRPRCMGGLYWQLNDCWPVASWSSIDYYGRWKALHYYAKRFYSPVLISPNLENDEYKFYIVSDLNEPIDAQFQVKIMNFSGKTFMKCEKQILIHPFESAVYHSIRKNDIPEFFDPHETFISCTLTSGDSIISENTLYFDLPKNLKLTPAEIKTAIEQTPSGFEITLSSKKLARSVILTAKDIEGHFEDNFFDLVPGRERKIHFLTKSNIEIAEFKGALSIMTLFGLMELG